MLRIIEVELELRHGLRMYGDVCYEKWTHLIDSGLDFSGGKYFLEFHLREIGCTDGLDLACLVKPFHLLPGILEVPSADYVTGPIW